MIRRRLYLAAFATVATALGLGQACARGSAPVTPAGSRAPASGIATPLGAGAGAPSTPNASPEHASSLNLEEFAPLVSEPGLNAVANLMEEGSFTEALSVFEKLGLPPQRSSEQDAVRWNYFRGRLQELAEQLAAARASYESAASVTWPLSAYARLAQGRVALRAGLHREAVATLQSVPRGQLAWQQARRLLAEAYEGLKEPLRAAENYRAYLAFDTEADGRAHVAERFTNLLLELASQAPRSGESGSDGRAQSQAFVREALALARGLSRQDTLGREALERAGALEQRALALMSPEERAQHAGSSESDDLVRVEAQLNARLYSSAHELANQLLNRLGQPRRFEEIGCETQWLRAKAMGGEREWGKAVDALGDVIRLCKDSDLRARALYVRGKYAAYDKRYASAARYFAQLEEEIPEHRLADDARLRRATAYLSLGAEARFTELLSQMPETYPNGDMVLDGVFELALRRIERGDWSGVLRTLEQGSKLAEAHELKRGREYSGRERYFYGRALLETNERERGLSVLERLIEELPLSYYSLHAYSRLHHLDPARADGVWRRGRQRAEERPLVFKRQPEFDSPGFLRALELLRQGEIESAEREIRALGVVDDGAAPDLLWAIALLYERAGAAKLSHALMRRAPSDWFGHWPAGDWMKVWHLAFPRPYRSIVQREAKRSGLPESWVYGVMREESTFDPRAHSGADAYGLMQLIEPTARHYGKKAGLPHSPRDLFRPAINIALGSRVLASFKGYFPKNELLAIPSYNAGPGRPRRWLKERPGVDFDVWVELIPFSETRRYTKRVLTSRAVYSYLYELEDDPSVLKLPLRLTL